MEIVFNCHNIDTLISKAQVKPSEKTGGNDTLGKGWYDIKPMEMDEKLKRDMKLIELRNYMDPKRFYKRADKPGKIVGIGTIVESSSEYFSSRLTKRERKQSFVDEILSDDSFKRYAKKTFLQIQTEKQNKKRMFNKKPTKKLRK